MGVIQRLKIAAVAIGSLFTVSHCSGINENIIKEVNTNNLQEEICNLAENAKDKPYLVGFRKWASSTVTQINGKEIVLNNPHEASNYVGGKGMLALIQKGQKENSSLIGNVGLHDSSGWFNKNIYIDAIDSFEKDGDLSTFCDEKNRLHGNVSAVFFKELKPGDESRAVRDDLRKDGQFGKNSALVKYFEPHGFYTGDLRP